jgi:SAM-dependent methyltransferase
MQISKCRLCNSKDIELALNLEPTPVADHYVTENELSTSQPAYPLDLYLCNYCGHVQLGYVVDPNILFKDYVYTSSISTSLLKHFEISSSELIQLLELEKKDLVVDIGSNDGSFLNYFKNAGINVVGVDPAEDIAQIANDSGIETIAEFFTPSTADTIVNTKGRAKLVTANNVFAHADNMGEIADGIFNLLTEDGIFVFEVSYMVDIVENMLFDTVYHEHLCYHTIKPLDSFLLSHDLQLINVDRIESKGGSIRCQVQKKGGSRSRSKHVDELIEKEKRENYDQLICYKKFSDLISSKKNEVLKWIDRVTNSKKIIAGYGASATVTTLLHYFELDKCLEFLVDDNKQKQGTYSPGTHIPVFDSKEIYRKEIDEVIILAWNYSQPIMKNNLEFLKRGGTFVIPLPDLRSYKEE